MRGLPDRLHIALAAASCAFVTILSACNKQPIDSNLTGDTRTGVVLSDGDSEHLRRGMRAYLESTQAIIEALSDNKLAAVQRYARKAGTSATSDVSLWVALSAPPEFVLLGMDTHQKFDALAAAAERHATKREILQHLRDILVNCTACHATFRLSVKRRQS
jgi:hypothetical protein